MEIISNIALISINETLIVQMLSFFVFLVIMDRIMFSPLNKVMEDRDTHIEKIKTDIGAAENKLTEISSKLEEKEKEARQEAFKQEAKLEDEGNQKASEIFAYTRTQILDSQKKAHLEIKEKIAEARKHLMEESEPLALHIMERLLERRLVS